MILMDSVSHPDGFLHESGPLECGGSTPLSFFAFFLRRSKKESGVEPPHSKVSGQTHRTLFF
jgi:hypothetical protein